MMLFLIFILFIVFIIYMDKSRQRIPSRARLICRSCGHVGDRTDWYDADGCPNCGSRKSSRLTFYNAPDIPAWYRRLNMLALLPVLLWPMVLYSSVFMFDSPSSDNSQTYLMFFAIIGYPAYILFFVVSGFRNFKKQQNLAVTLTLIPIFAFLLLLVTLFSRK